MANSVVVLYVSQFDKSLQWHHKVVLEAVAKAIAKIKRYDFGGTLRGTMRLFWPSFLRAWRYLAGGGDRRPRDSFLERSVRWCGPASFHEDESDYSWPHQSSCGATIRLVHGLCRASARHRVARRYRIQQLRCPAGGETHAYARTNPCEETAQRIGKRSDRDYKFE